MADRHEPLWAALEESVLRGKGHTTPERRRAAYAGGPLPAELQALVDRIRHHAYRVTNEEIAALKTQHSEDELFELVIAASLGAARERLRAGLRAVEQA